ncbi:MAG: NAD(P)-binding domain-containing protein [Gallionella sp.]
MKAGFIGIGQMGAGMAARLRDAGCDLAVYNRSVQPMQPLVMQGAKAAKNIPGVLRDRYLELAAHGGEHLDWSAIGSLAAKDAALIS